MSTATHIIVLNLKRNLLLGLLKGNFDGSTLQQILVKFLGEETTSIIGNFLGRVDSDYDRYT